MCVLMVVSILLTTCYSQQEAKFDVKLVPSIADRELDFWFYSPGEYGPYIPMVNKVYQGQVF
ncbi:MAG: hypothetical protein ABFD79_07710, partial [Phycisphaerales bacterium]